MSRDYKSSVLKCCATIRLKADESFDATRSRKTEPFRNPIAFNILDEIASGLRGIGYKVGQTRQGKACDALVHCNLAEFSLTIFLLANINQKPDDLLEFHLQTRPTRPLINFLLFRNSKIERRLVEAWNELCVAVNQQLQTLPNIESVLWLTRGEAEIQWSKS